ncbi:putative haustorium-specific membrane protein [Phytophthora cinnamomi]|uniref:putative haustorium-specific membrane protein n=1 Tax=Phytophthora cinnamomi TaxID=4785 RepID=UPI00355A85FC|nr:putative haustorium-specific membrane protein [Phytophthora cinnamomi]
MVLRAVKVLVQAALLVQVLQVTGSVNGLQVNENFQNTPLSAQDAPGTVKAGKIPSSVNNVAEEGEERGLWSWITGKKSSSTPASDTGASLATTTPIPGTEYVRPSYSSMLSQFGSLKGEFEKNAGKSSTASAGADSSTGAGSDAASGSEATTKKPLTKKKKKPLVAAAPPSDSSAASESGSGSEAATPKTKRPAKKTRKPVVATSSSESASEAASGSGDVLPKTKKPAKKTRKPVAAANSESASEETSGSSLDDLLGSDASGSSLSDLLDDSSSGTSLADLLGSSGGSGSNDLSSLLDSSGSGGGLGGLGSGSLSFADFMKEYGSLFGSGSSAIDLFGDPTAPQNNTIDDGDITLSQLYGGAEHGNAFSDIKNIKFGQMILNVTLRGERRLDQVGLMVFTQEAVGNLVHGGTGGSEKFAEMEMGDTITEIEIHWDKNKGKTCIFYLAITTSAKKTVAVGSKTANSIVLTPPKGFQFAGFYGRASSSAVFCLGAIWTKSGVTDLAVTDIMAVPAGGSPDVYNYKTTIRNWVGPLETASDNACYQKRFGVSSQGTCPSGFNKDKNKCVTQCPLNYPLDCLMECIPQNADCTQEIISKVASVVAVALNAATLGVFGTLVSAYKAANFALTCAINVVNAVKSIIYYLRYKQTTIPTTDTEKLMDKAFQLQIVILDLPMAISACFGLKIPPKLMFSATILAVVSAVVMMAVMVGEAIFASSDNVMLMLRESGVLNTTALDKNTLDLSSFLNSKNGTCGYEMRTLTNRVMGKVYEVRNNTPNAAANDVRVAVSESSIIKTDIPVVTNHCMGQIWTNKTSASSYSTRNLLRKTLGVIVDQIVEDGTTDMGKNVVKKEKALEYSNLGLFILSVFDPTGIAWMASEFVQPICGPTEYLGEIDDGTLYDALGLTTVDQAFLGSYGIWKKKGDGTVTLLFESVDSEDVSVVIKSGELAFDRVVLRENCVFRMRKPDWNVDEKTPMYNKLHQMRLAMIQTRAVSLATIDTQKKLRTKYSHDLIKAQEAIKKLEEMKIEAAANMRRVTKEQLRVDSDVFDTFSKQLIDAETLLPDLKARLDKATASIATEQCAIKASAILIQRIYRGFRDRIYLKRFKIRSSLTERVGALVDQFIVSGNFWGFILEIDADYRRFMHKIEEEEADATTFLSTVLRQRKLDEDQMMQDWFTASALENPLVSGIDQVTKAYSSDEGNSSGSSVSQAMLQSALVEDLVALSPNKRKGDLLPPDFPPKVIRQAMAKGFSLSDTIAVMRGLQAQRKNIEDTDLVLSTLHNRAPLMANPWTSERVLREARDPNKVTMAPATKATSALRCYDPGNRGEKGRYVACDDRNSEIFQSYLRTESPLVKIRSEQQAMEATKPFLNTLLENRCYTAYDILYNVRGIGELVSWNIPGPLAKSIYSVIQEIHDQSTRVSKRNIVREARVSADFERFLNTRVVEQSKTPAPEDTLITAPSEHIESAAENSLNQVKYRLETEVLGLPLQDVSMAASELLFKAAFVVDGDITTEEPTIPETYQSFLFTLLTLQTAGNIETMKQHIAARVTHAKAIADAHSEIFKLFGVASVSDLLKDNLAQVLIRDQVLQQKVAELLEPFATVNWNLPLELDHPILPSHPLKSSKTLRI